MSHKGLNVSSLWSSKTQAKIPKLFSHQEEFNNKINLLFYQENHE